MATHSTGHIDDAALMVRPTAELSRLGSRSFVLGGIGLALTALGFLIARDTFMQSCAHAVLDLGQSPAYLGDQRREPGAALLEQLEQALALAQPHGAEIVERLLEQSAPRA